MSEEKVINLEPVIRKFNESRVGQFLFDLGQRVKKTFKRRHPHSIKIDTVPRPLPVLGEDPRRATLAANNSLPYVILSEEYGLREENRTLDLVSIIEKARRKNFLENMPLSHDALRSFGRVSAENGFITINFLKQFSGDYDPKYLFDKFVINETVFRRPEKTLWVYNDNNFGDGIRFYQIKIRLDIEDLDEVILGQDLFIKALEVPNHQIESTIEYDCEVEEVLTGYRRKANSISNITNNPHVAPNESTFADIFREKIDHEKEEKDDLVELPDGVEKINLEQFGGIKNGSEIVKKIEAEEYTAKEPEDTDDTP